MTGNRIPTELWDELDFEPRDGYALMILTLAGDASTPPPLLADPVLAALVARDVAASAHAAPGRLWGGYVVLPDALRLVVGPGSEQALDTYVEVVRERTTRTLYDTLARREADTLDRVLRYSPVWGGVIGRVWQAGMHRALFTTEYKLSNALYSLRMAPVVAGLVENAEAWPFLGGMERGD